ncbi:MAG TPA: S9 family peptidase [Acidimicrobiales bacterium]|nr:S9 family peptidase [Acidimicrobiales bacterium]
MTSPLVPHAPRRPIQLTNFGDARVDDYFWLRDRDNPEVLAYLEAENEFAVSALAATDSLRNQVYDEIVSRIEETDVSAPVRWGAWWYYMRTFEGRSYPVHCRRPLGDGAFPASLDEEGEQVLLDENALAEGRAFCFVGVLEVAPSHGLAAVGVDFDGDERHAVTFLSLDGREAPSETITGVGYSVAWSSDDSSLLYVRVDEAWRPYELWRHVLGTDPGSDVLLYREDDERFLVSIGRSRDATSLLVHVASQMTTEVLTLDAASPDSLRTVWPRRQGIECSIEHLVAPSGDSWWIAVTNDQALDFKVVAARDAATLEFREIIEERRSRRIEGVDAFAQHLVVTERLDGCASVRVIPLNGGEDPFGDDFEERGFTVESDESPATTMIDQNPEFETSTVRIAQTTLVTPASSVDVDLASGERLVRKRRVVRGGYDPSRYVSSRIWVTARDGAEIPVSLVHRRDLLEQTDEPGSRPAPLPIVLYGYGAYEVCIEPTFASARLSLLDRGVAYAIAHVRGGGELGRAWYDAGHLEHKQTTFCDFVDVAQGLVAHGYTDASRLVAMGGSAGGLLMGASMNLEPSSFRAVVAEVPFVDVLNTMLDESLPLTVSEWEEWGDPIHDEAAYFRIKSWSPYDNVPVAAPDGTPSTYPDLLVLGSLNDTRVSYWEPAKWVAKIRATSPMTNVVFKTDLGSGHGGPSGRYDSWRERAMVFAFVLDKLGMLDAPTR